VNRKASAARPQPSAHISFNDPGWVPLKEAIQRGNLRTNNPRFTLDDIKAGHKEGVLPVMIRAARDPELEPLPPDIVPATGFIDWDWYALELAMRESVLYVHESGLRIIWPERQELSSSVETTPHPGGKPRTYSPKLREEILLTAARICLNEHPKSAAALRRAIAERLNLDPAKGPDPDSTWFKKLVDPIFEEPEKTKP
jgi:hypothetical protein